MTTLPPPRAPMLTPVEVTDDPFPPTITPDPFPPLTFLGPQGEHPNASQAEGRDTRPQDTADFEADRLLARELAYDASREPIEEPERDD